MSEEKPGDDWTLEVFGHPVELPPSPDWDRLVPAYGEEPPATIFGVPVVWVVERPPGDPIGDDANEKPRDSGG